MTKQESILEDPRYIPVHNHGFVGLIETMGSDHDICRAARVSYGTGTKSVSDDRNLLRYLMRHHHSTPIEMCEVKYHIKLPIAIMRQLIRHRTACLTGDTKLWFDNAGSGGFRFKRPMSVKDFHDKFHNGSRPLGKYDFRISLKQLLQRMRLRTVDENTGAVGHTSVKDIWSTGTKPVYKVILTNGFSIKTSKDHRFFTDQGWKKLSELVTIENHIPTFWLTDVLVATNGQPRYLSQSWQDRDKTIPREYTNVRNIQYKAIRLVEYAGEQETFDLEVTGPFNNFIADGICVHNSVNEYSARYSVLSDEFYVPSHDYIAPQSLTNKQGRSGELCLQDKEVAQALIQKSIDRSNHDYHALLGEPCEESFSEEFGGISRELARIVVPVANYTEAYWKIDLKNFFGFLKLRMDSHAQQEMQDFANPMYELAKPHFPLVCEAFEDYMLNAVTLSSMDIAALKDLLNGTMKEGDHYGMSKREYTEFVDRWAKPPSSKIA